MTPLHILTRAPSRPRVPPPPTVGGAHNLAALTADQKAAVAKAAIVLGAVTRGEIDPADPSALAAQQIFDATFPGPAGQPDKTVITAADAEAALKKWNRW